MRTGLVLSANRFHTSQIRVRLLSHVVKSERRPVGMVGLLPLKGDLLPSLSVKDWLHPTFINILKPLALLSLLPFTRPQRKI